MDNSFSYLNDFQIWYLFMNTKVSYMKILVWNNKTLVLLVNFNFVVFILFFKIHLQKKSCYLGLFDHLKSNLSSKLEHISLQALGKGKLNQE